MNIVIAVATYRRPKSLRDCLEGIARLTISRDVNVAVVVVDNDQDAPAQTIVSELSTRCSWTMHYYVEPVRNISLARNRAVQAAMALHADYVAFIDDDEVPEAAWLQELLSTALAASADVVWGPVFARYPDSVAAWIREGPFIQSRTDWPADYAFSYAYTCNVLVKTLTFNRVTCLFDPFYGLSGGGDLEFFMRAHAAGARIVWAAAARVHETVPVSRATARWILRRAFRYGNSRAFIHRRSLRRGSARYALRALLLLAAGALMMAPAILLSRAQAMLWACRFVSGVGGLAGLAGYQFLEYRETHGG